MLDKNVKLAQEHIKYIEKHFKDEIQYSADNGLVYTDVNFTNISCDNIPIITILDKSIPDVLKDINDDCTVVNCGSFQKPGGGFDEGLMGREVALCQISSLYNVLIHFNSEYIYNRSLGSNSLKRNWAIWTPNIIFATTNGEKKVNVITCPSIHKMFYNYLSSNKEESNKIYKNYLYNRCKYILDIANSHKTKYLVFEDYGFNYMNNQEDVAKIFKELLDTDYYNFKEVIFTITGTRSCYRTYLDILI